MGRAVIAGTGEEAQIAEVAGPPGVEPDGAIRSLVEQVRARDEPLANRWPRRIEALPRRLPLADVLRRGRPAVEMTLPVLLGLSGETSLPVYVDLDGGIASAFIAGPPRSGRTTALLSIAEVLLSHGVSLAVINPRGSALSGLAARSGVTVVIVGPDARRVDLEVLEGKVQVALIDDAELLDPDHPAHLALVNRTASVAVVAAASTEELSNGNRGWLAALKRPRTGVLLSPRTKYDGALFGGTLPDHMVFQGPPGRGVVGIAGRTDIVQLPLPDSP